MKFYRLHKFEIQDASHGFEFFTTKRDAERAFRAWIGDDEESVCNTDGTKIEEINITPTKDGILRALTLWASHPDNG